jgi:two-component system sensor histidine kinase DevS
MTQSPKILINLAVLSVAALAFLAISAVLYPPYTGFMLGYDEDSDSMRVVRLDGWVEEQGLRLGDSIQSITNADGMEVVIERKHILKSSEEARLYFANRNERLNEIDRMHELFSNSPLVVTKGNGVVTNLTLDHQRPISSLSLSFWIVFLSSLTAPLVASLAWAWQPKKPETSLLLLSGIGFFLSCLASTTSIYSNDMFYLPLLAHWLTRVALDIGQFSFILFGTAVLLFYPNRFSFSPRALKYLLIGFFLYPPFAYFNSWSISDLNLGEYPRFTDAETYSPMLFMFGLTITLCWKQYLASRDHPVQRAQTLWIILAWTIGPGVFVLFYLLPRWLGDGPILRGSAFLFPTILTTYLMVFLGIARLNLFQLEQYIGQAYQWVMISVLFLGLDITLISFVNLSPQVSNGIILIAVLWGYIPIRHWIHKLLTADQKNRSQALTSEAVVLMVRNSLDSRTMTNESWLQVVRSLFRPGNISPLSSVKESSIALRGQQLIVAGNSYSPALQLDFADGGSRLFSKKDLDLANTLNVLFEKLYDVRDSFLEGQTQERDRIRRDLHDQIGHKLLSLIYAAGDEKSRSLAQETMAQLSELIQAMKQEPIQLDDLATRARGVCDDICTNAKLKLDWQNSLPAESMGLISSDQFLNILNILRELLSNTIKHAGANGVRVSLEHTDNFINLGYSDDGSGFDQEKVNPGNGLFNLQSRAAELNAKMEWDTSGGTLFKLVIPLDTGDANHG